ncbi:MAG: glutathione peroxidase [Pseudomonadota bacterium]
MRALVTAVLALMMNVTAAFAFEFPSIDGGTIKLDDWAGRPVLVVNTASRCGFTPQYDGLQALYDRYRDRGLVVLTVPSNDFRQELASEAEVKEFCEVNFNLDMPMTEITKVRGAGAHPFYAWVAETEDFSPRWNFNKILIDPEGQVAATFGSTTRPTSRSLTDLIEPMLGSAG